MKRSEINQIMLSAEEFLRRHSFYLPPFASWTPQDWAQKGDEVREIVENRLGWDITDFGLGDFRSRGLFLFTLRNGRPTSDLEAQNKPYCEKIMIVGDGQITPYHFHWSKTEDIINRGGGKLLVQVYASTPDETLDQEAPVVLSTDGVQRRLPAGAILELTPGESVTLPPYCYHQFWGQGTTLVGEVSAVNDDSRDNRFLGGVGRFPVVDEDEAPLHLLVSDYPRYYSS